jgi:hypothetical protein
MIEILIFLAGAFVGFKIEEYSTNKAITELFDRLGITDAQLENLYKHRAQENIKLVTIKIERHQDQFYAYDADTEEFLGQGSDSESLLESIKQRDPNVRVSATVDWTEFSQKDQ